MAFEETIISIDTQQQVRKGTLDMHYNFYASCNMYDVHGTTYDREKKHIYTSPTCVHVYAGVPDYHFCGNGSKLHRGRYSWLLSSTLKMQPL